ncbi:hypothetical protein GII02_07420 [Lactococcus lactis]|uniref:hypothetical protein n=1 Tax=Lactococcus lactis TaxID=1358 RepID=UPI0012E8AF1C|nr:hypothetical protein [Lactococcus lactis]MUV47249.1 hypothetical protein [Lactococcus lactis]
MIINVLNKDLIPVTFIDNDVPGLPSYYKDTLVEYLGLGTSSFEFTILKTKNNTIQDYSRFFNRETSFSFEKGGKQYAVFPAGSDGFYETDTEITYKCLSLDRELSLEYVDKLDNTSSHSLQWYIDYFGLILNSQIEIGQNDVSDYTRVIKYDSQDTKLNRLISLINNFDGEFEFVTKLSDNGAVDKIILNIVKKRDDLEKNGIGSTREDVELVYGKNVKGIERTYNFEFFNASKVTGKDGINWNSSEFSYVNSDGVEEFYKRKNEDTAFAPLSAQKYPAHLRKDSSDIWLRKNFETEYTTPAQMWGYIVQQFKSYAYPQVTYKVKTNSSLVSNTFDGKLPIQIGDTITIEDDNFSNDQGDFGLILRARATQIKSSESNPESNEITFENFVELQNELSDDLMAQVNQLVDAATPYRAELTTTNGTQFKNGTGSTTLSAHIFKGSAMTETIADSYEWSKDGTVVAPTQTITVDASGVVDKAVYSFKATVGGKVVASQSVTITNVNDGAKGVQGPQGPQGPQGLKGDPGATGIPGQAGADGKTSYLHIAYATNSTGTAGFDVSNATGKTYIGQYTDFTSADSTDPSKYTWSLIKGDKGDKGDTGPQGPQGERGIAGATGATGSPGPKGADGRSSYIHIKYAPVINPTDSQITDTPNAYIGVYTDYNQADSTSASAYTWSKWQGEDGANGVAGAKGADGRTTYVHFAYANSTNGQTNFSTSYFDGALYMGTLTDYTQTDSTNYAAYTWSRLKGDKGDKGDQGIQGLQGPTGTQGVAGPKGADGKTQYTHIAYANSADGVTNFSTSDSNRAYIGMYVDFNINDSNTPSDYAWTLVKGADGTQGTPGKAGADGKTPYFHTAWSYSADGMDRFTTVYPRFNLLEGSKKYTKEHPLTVSSNATDGYYYVSDVFVKNLKAGTYTMSAKADAPWTIHGVSDEYRQGKVGLWLVSNTWEFISLGDTVPKTIEIRKSGDYFVRVNTYSNGKDIVTHKFWDFKLEEGSTATPHMPSASEVTTADYPSYIGQYTDFAQADSTNPSDYTWSLIRGNDGKDGADGKDGIAGKDGDPGKIVSDTEPTTRFKGLTWKYSGTTDLTASDGIVIHPNTEYYYNGTHWMINYLSANNIEANSIKADKIDAKNLTITDGEFVSTTTNGPVTTSTEIKDNHIAISKTDGTVNTKNDLAVDTEQGFAMKFTNNTTGLTREASVNFQGVSTSDSNGNFAQLTPQGTKLSTDVPWTDITRSSGVGTSGTLRARINNGVFYAQSKDVTIPSIAPNSLITIGTMSSKFSGVSGFDTLGLLYSLGQLSVASVTVGNDGKINIGNPNPTTMSGKVIQFSINIPLG